MDGTPTTDELQARIELTFKPLPPGQHLRAEERRLISAFIGEILKGVEEEEKLIIEEEKTASKSRSSQ